MSKNFDYETRINAAGPLNPAHHDRMHGSLGHRPASYKPGSKCSIIKVRGSFSAFRGEVGVI